MQFLVIAKIVLRREASPPPMQDNSKRSGAMYSSSRKIHGHARAEAATVPDGNGDDYTLLVPGLVIEL